MSTSDLLSHVSAGKASERPGHAAEHSTQKPQEGFIYVYDMPGEFTDGLTQLPVQWHPSQYDYDQVRCTQDVSVASIQCFASPKSKPLRCMLLSGH